MNQETADAMLNKLEVLTDGSLTIAGVFEEMEEYINSLVVEDEQKNEAFKILQMMIIQDAELYDKLLTATGFAYWFNKLAQLASGVEIDLSEVETDEEISLRMWEEWVDYMNEHEPCPMGDHRVPPKLRDWLKERK